MGRIIVYLFELDLTIAEAFQRKTIQFQEFTGKNCFFLGRITAILAPWPVIVCFFIFPPKYPTFSLVLCIITMTSTCLNLIGIRAAELIIWHQIKAGKPAMNPLIHSDTLLRLSFFALALILLPSSMTDGFIVWVILELITMYLIACTPDPPSQSKLEEWLKKAKEKINAIIIPSPTPEPMPIGSR